MIATFPIIQLVVFILYVSYLVYRYGVLESISYSYYKTGERRLFQLFCFLIGLPFLTYGDPFFMIACFGLLLVGMTDDYMRVDSRVVGKVHYKGAGVGIGAALIGLGWVYVAVFAGVLTPLLFVRNRVWWIEIAAFVVIGAGLINRFMI